MDRDKVIKALECCTKKVCIYKDTEKECPYWELSGEYEPSFEDCTTALSKDALAMLRAQEPRVMTLDELVMWQKQPVIERDPIYVEYRKGKGFGAPHWAMDNFGFNVATCQDNYKSGVYGMLVRCWTSRPDEKRRAETPWE